MSRDTACGGVLGLAALASACAVPAPNAQSRYVDAMERAARNGTTFVHASQALPDLDLPGAYAIQHQVVHRQIAAGNRISGYKSSLMSAKSLADRKAREPLVAVLFASGAAKTGSAVQTCGYRRPVLEMKIGFTFDREVRHSVPSVAALKAMVDTVVPVVELPDIAYADDKTYVALDMVAANISSARFVRGTPQPIPAVDLDATTVSIARDGKVITRGKGAESLDGQWPSLLLTVNLLIANGYGITPGQFVLTGKVGDKLDLKPGAYRADYGSLGTVDFVIGDCPSPVGSAAARG